MKQLTQPEEEAMQVFWTLNGDFTKEVLGRLPEPRLSYTTLASTVRNLKRKGYLVSEKHGNTYRFAPCIPAEEYRKCFLGTFVSEYFQNSYKELVSFLAKDQKISAKELKEIIGLVEQQHKP